MNDTEFGQLVRSAIRDIEELKGERVRLQREIASLESRNHSLLIDLGEAEDRLNSLLREAS